MNTIITIMTMNMGRTAPVDVTTMTMSITIITMRMMYLPVGVRKRRTGLKRQP
jgi:hypothetical protein